MKHGVWLVGVVLAAAVRLPAAGQGADAGTAKVLQSIDAKRQQYADAARQIWGFAEVGYQEEKSSAVLQSLLTGAGFTVQRGVAEIPTAFVGSFGTGKPVVAIIGEFDALPSLSQEASPVRKAVVANAPGHGCGHNLYGTGGVAAAIALKEWLQSTGRPGTVRFYGTPAEEGGGGKVYMLRAGLFNDVDAAIAWHPGDRNDASPGSSLANISGKFSFRGLSAHASSAPDKGRSALDGVEAMDAMVNMLREHVPQDTRIHYVITNGGGAPNVVPNFAQVYYYARSPQIATLDPIWDRIVNAAKGAALGTETTMELEIINAVYNLLPNEYLSGLQRKNLERVGGVTYSAEEQTFALELRRTVEAFNPDLAIGSQEQIQPQRRTAMASTDLGDVSWSVPTVGMTAATFVPGTPGHSWQAVACAGSSIGAKGMLVAAKTMALTAIDLFSDPRHIQQARVEFEKRRGVNFVYKPRVGDRKPPLDYRGR